MKIYVKEGLLYVKAGLSYQGHQQIFENVLIDTGSAGTMFATDSVLEMGLTYEPDDAVHRIRGVGGTEFVFTKQVDGLFIGVLQVNDFSVEVGAMNYGFVVDGIIGLDFLTQVKAVIDLSKMEIYLSQAL